MNQPIRKRYSLKAEVSDNSIRCVASTTGNPDRMGDVIFPGGFAGAAKAFVTDGFVAIGHDWDDLPVAMPTGCSEQDGQLICEAQFHNTPEAQAARTVCQERMDAGKSVSVSVGFLPDYSLVKWCDSGADLLAYADAMGCDMAGFDTKAIKALGMCRAIPKVAELFEFSIVGVGMNRRAKATAVKTFLDDAGSLSDLTLSDHLDAVLSAGEGIAVRLADYKASRDREDRPMSPDRVAQLKRLHELVGSLLMGAEIPETTPENEDDRYALLALRTLDLRTRLAG